MSKTIDVAVIGGGPAGLAAALALVRSRKHVALYDCWPPRNATASEVRGFVTQDGTPPEEVRRLGREDLASYETFELHDDDRVRAVRGEHDRFVITSEHGEAIARRILLCVGICDQLPDIPGYRELWGTSVFQCPHCHGWERKDRAFGYLANDAAGVDWSLLLRGWTRDLVVFTSAAFDVPAALIARLDRARIRLEQRRVVALEAKSNELSAVVVDGGVRVPREVLFVRPPQIQTKLVRELGVKLDSRDRVHVDERGETSIRGIYAAGDLMMAEHGALAAAAAGARVAHELDEAFTRELVLAGER